MASKLTVDFATGVGLAASGALIAGAIAMGDDARAFVDLPSVLITVLGTATVALTSATFGDVAAVLRLVGGAFVSATPDVRLTARELLSVAEQVRSAGPLSIQKQLARFAPGTFARRALEMVADDMRPEDIARTLQQEIDAAAGQRERAIRLVRRAADVAPAMGLIGTLVGLVQMLGNLSSPESIGPAMAVALLTTFYGAIMSTIVLSPLAAKLERRGEGDLLDRAVVAIAAGSMARRENPRRLEMLINAVLPPNQRVRHFD